MAAARRQNIRAYLRNTYPNLDTGWSNRQLYVTPRWVNTPLSQRPLGRLLWIETQNGLGTVLQEAEAALARLAPRFMFAHLRDQYRLLFSPDEHDFEAGLGETLGLGALEQEGVLNSVGYPAGAATPPFDCSVTLASTAVVGVDFKTASNSGFENLRQLLQTEADTWRRGLGLQRCSVEIDWAGTLTQESVRTAAAALTTAWSAFLGRVNATLPTVRFVHQTPEFDIEVRVVGRGAIAANRGIGGVGPAALRGSKTISKHARHKARNGIPFFLAYVARPGRPAGDLRRGILHPAAIIAHRRESRLVGQAHQHWLGLLSIDLTGIHQSIQLLARYAAGWPQGRADADSWLRRFARFHTRYRQR